MRIGEKEHKVAAYADDILVYVNKPRETLSNLLKEIDKYGELSNFKINPVKTKILNLKIRKKEISALQKEFPFTWVKGELSYLGIKLTASSKKIYSTNYIPLLNEIKIEAKKVNIQALSWIGRVNVIKMAILPKILYKLQMLPVTIPQSFFKIIQKIITKFIWQNKKTTLKMALISRKRQHGGLTAPDISRYYKAVIIARMIEWTKENEEKNGSKWKTL